MGYRMDRNGLIRFYKNKKKPKKSLQAKIITVSIERMIERGLLVGYGVRTPRKWFIKEIRLTKEGIKLAKKLLGEQMKLPLK